MIARQFPRTALSSENVLTAWAVLALMLVVLGIMIGGCA